MLDLALKMLFGDHAISILLISGLTFASLLMFICWLADLLGIRRIRSLKPAVVFRG